MCWQMWIMSLWSMFPLFCWTNHTSMVDFNVYHAGCNCIWYEMLNPAFQLMPLFLVLAYSTTQKIVWVFNCSLWSSTFLTFEVIGLPFRNWSVTKSKWVQSWEMLWTEEWEHLLKVVGILTILYFKYSIPYSRLGKLEMGKLVACACLDQPGCSSVFRGSTFSSF